MATRSRISPNSLSGETSIPVTKLSNGSFQLDEKTMISRGLDLPQQRLASNRQDNQIGTINWLGSSYAGADITVVAHMYNQDQSQGGIKELAEQKAYYQALSSAVDAIIPNIRTFLTIMNNAKSMDEVFSIFSTMTQLTMQDEADQKARETLWGKIIQNSLSGPGAEGRLAILLSSLRDFYKRQATLLGQKITTLKEEDLSSANTITFGSLQTLSLQTHRGKTQVRACGFANPKGIARGTRTIGGSMIFTVFDETAFASLIRGMQGKESIWNDPSLSSLFPDQLPPIDITISFANEYGSLSELRIFGVEFMGDGMTLSIEDLFTEQVVSFMARDADVLTSKGKRRLSSFDRANPPLESKTASSLMFNNQSYKEYLGRIGMRNWKKNR